MKRAWLQSFTWAVIVETIRRFRLGFAPDSWDALLTAANASHETAAIGSITGNLVGAWVGADRLRDELPRWWAATERLEELLAFADLLVDTSADLAEGEDPPLTLLG